MANTSRWTSLASGMGLLFLGCLLFGYSGGDGSLAYGAESHSSTGGSHNGLCDTLGGQAHFGGSIQGMEGQNSVRFTFCPIEHPSSAVEVPEVLAFIMKSSGLTPDSVTAIYEMRGLQTDRLKFAVKRGSSHPPSFSDILLIEVENSPDEDRDIPPVIRLSYLDERGNKVGFSGKLERY